MKNYLALLLLTLALGCKSLAPGTPADPSPYHGDKILFEADQSIVTGYDLLHAFVSWEYANRAALAGVPEIHKAAETIRLHTGQWFATAIALRNAYSFDASSANRNALATSLGVIRAALTQSVTYLQTYGPARPVASQTNSVVHTPNLWTH